MHLAVCVSQDQVDRIIVGRHRKSGTRISDKKYLQVIIDKRRKFGEYYRTDRVKGQLEEEKLQFYVS